MRLALSDRAIAWMTFFALAVLYFSTRTHVHYYADDSIRWAIDVEQGHLLHQHHLVYLLLGHWFYRVGSVLGLVQRSLPTLQFLSALCGAAAVSFFYLLLRRLATRRSAALLVASCLAFTFGFWGYSAASDVYMPATMALCLGALILLDCVDNGLSVRRSLAASLVLLLAVTLHQASILFFPVLLLGVWLAPGSRRSRWRHSLLITSGTGGTLLVVYFAAYSAQSNPTTLSGFLTYMMGYVAEMPMLPGDSGFSRSTLPRAAMGLSQALLNGNILFHWDWSFERIQNALPAKFLADDRYLVRNLGGAASLFVVLGITGFAAAFVLLVVTQARRILPRMHSRRFALFASWFVLQALFFTWWEAGSNEFWIASLVPFFVLLTLGLVGCGGDRTTRIALGVLSTSLFLVNGLSAIFPAMDADNDYWMANKAYLSQVEPEDVVITYDSHTPRISAQYFSSARILNLFPPPGGHIDEAEVLRTVDACVGRGGRIIVDPRAWHPDNVTLITSRFFDARNAARYPELLAEIAARHGEKVYLVPVLASAGEEIEPILRPEDVQGARALIVR